MLIKTIEFSVYIISIKVVSKPAEKNEYEGG